MKRSQINRHRFTWILLAPILVITILSAMMVKPAPDSDANASLPDFLTEEAR